MKIATIYPDRITIRHSSQVPTYWEVFDKKVQRESRVMNNSSLLNLSKPKTSINLSKASQKKLKDTVSLLYYLAKPRTVQISSKKFIYNFRLSFITLTLPSQQVHTDVEIKNTCLNNFLNTMRNRFGLKNYVWVSEIQENGNLHFHLVFDLYIHHKAVRYYWNKSLELLGYVSAYRNKMNSLSLKEYSELRKLPVSQVASAYYKSVKEGWSNPPTEQAVTIFNTKNLVNYLAKYVTKNNKDVRQENEARAETWGRGWGRSSTLSKIKFISHFDWDSISSAINRIADIKSFTVHRVYDYCEVIYFQLSKVPTAFMKWLNRKMVELGITYNFEPSGEVL